MTDVVDSEMRKYRADIIARAKQILQPSPVIAGKVQDVDMQFMQFRHVIQLQGAIVIEDTFSDTFPSDWDFCKISTCAPPIFPRIIFIVGLWALQKGHVVNNVLKNINHRGSFGCVCFITAGPIAKLCAWGEEESGGHVL